MGARGHPLFREIALVLALKAAAIAVIWLAFFGPETRPDIDGTAVDRHLTVIGKATR
jgi:hypothetical protein